MLSGVVAAAVKLTWRAVRPWRVRPGHPEFLERLFTLSISARLVYNQPVIGNVVESAVIRMGEGTKALQTCGRNLRSPSWSNSSSREARTPILSARYVPTGESKPPTAYTSCIMSAPVVKDSGLDGGSSMSHNLHAASRELQDVSLTTRWVDMRMEWDHFLHLE